MTKIHEPIAGILPQYRQGDTLTRKIDALPDYMKGIEPLDLTKTPEFEVQRSVGSPRPHTMASKDIKVWQTTGQEINMFIEVTNPDGTPLCHPEHDNILIPQGLYAEHKQMYFDELERVSKQAID